MLLLYLLIVTYGCYGNTEQVSCILHEDCINRPRVVCNRPFCGTKRCSVDTDCPSDYHSACMPFYCNNVSSLCDIHRCDAIDMYCNMTTKRCQDKPSLAPIRFGATPPPPPSDNEVQMWPIGIFLFIVAILLTFIIGCWLAHRRAKKIKTGRLRSCPI